MKTEEVLLAIPHAGTEIPTDIRARMPHGDETLLREPDLYTDRIFAIPGTQMVLTPYSRIIGDCNRAPDELYTEGRLRAESVVMLSQADGQDVFETDPDIAELTSWIEKFHKPFHESLSAHMSEAKFLFDCHSLSSVGEAAHIDAGTARADIVLGNRQYSACSAETTHFFRAYFERHGYSVAINEPYPGRYILGTYCSRIATPGIQIEINRKLYLDEKTLEPYESEIKKLNGQISDLISEFCSWYETSDPRNKPMTDMSE